MNVKQDTLWSTTHAPLNATLPTARPAPSPAPALSATPTSPSLTTPALTTVELTTASTAQEPLAINASLTTSSSVSSASPSATSKTVSPANQEYGTCARPVPQEWFPALMEQNVLSAIQQQQIAQPAVQTISVEPVLLKSILISVSASHAKLTTVSTVLLKMYAQNASMDINSSPPPASPPSASSATTPAPPAMQTDPAPPANLPIS